MDNLPQIPGYRLERKIGHGGMADVFLGIQENLQREVAIKVLEASLFRDEQFSERFKNEALTAAKLTHPNIINIHDIGQISGTYYIVMEYLQESLKDRMRKIGIMPPREALEIIKTVASALEYAHNKGFIHRDIKPDNIMFRLDGTPVLVDFGIARAIDSASNLTRTGTSIGTPYYMSPEQCRGEKIDGRSDIYALGVLLYQLLTGKLPYKAENTTGIILKHIQEPVPNLPPELNQYQLLLDKMMAKDKEMRISGGAELIKFIDGFLTAQEQQLIPESRLTEATKLEVPLTEQLTVPTPQPPTAALFTKQPNRKKRPLLFLVFVAIIIIGITIYFLNLSKSVKTGTKTSTEKDTTSGIPATGIPANATGEKINIIPSGTETSPVETKDNTGGSPSVKNAGTKLTETPGKPVKESSPQIDRMPKDSTKNDVAASSESQIKIATLVDLQPEIRNEYNSRMEQIQISYPNPNIKVVGQVSLNLEINENGGIKIQNFQAMILVTPLLHERLVKMAIGKKIKNLYLPPPKNKEGEPVKVSNWKIIYKVGKNLNNIILTKQNKDL